MLYNLHQNERQSCPITRSSTQRRKGTVMMKKHAQQTISKLMLVVSDYLRNGTASGERRAPVAVRGRARPGALVADSAGLPTTPPAVLGRHSVCLSLSPSYNILTHSPSPVCTAKSVVFCAGLTKLSQKLRKLSLVPLHQWTPISIFCRSESSNGGLVCTETFGPSLEDYKVSQFSCRVCRPFWS